MLSVFENKPKLLRYILVWLLYAVLHFYSFSMFTRFQSITLVIDTLLFTVLYGTTGILLMYILKYAGLNKLNVFQRNLNCFVLFVVVIALVVGVGNYVLMLVVSGNEEKEMLLRLIPLRVLISILIYNLIVTFYRLSTSEQYLVAEELEISETEEASIVEEPSVPKETIDRIAVKIGQKIHVIAVNEIICLQAYSDYVYIFTAENKYIKEQTMKFFDENLPATKFVRVHRSYIVNVEAISRVELYEKQTQLLTLKTGMQIRMSQSGYKLLKMKLKL